MFDMLAQKGDFIKHLMENTNINVARVSQKAYITTYTAAAADILDGRAIIEM
jgi:hypothetical protein